MAARRFDVIPLEEGWWLTDSGTLGLPFNSAEAALESARSLADQHDGEATVHHWRRGEPIEVYRSPGRQEPSASS